MHMTAEKIAVVTGGTLVGPGSAVARYAVCDTRKLARPGGLFAAFRGAREDGHDYLQVAADRGATVALVTRSTNGELRKLSNRMALVEVDDVHEALWALAAQVRKEFVGPTAALTGSVAKTTTKDIARVVLDEFLGKGCVTEGNMNNLLGVPLTILGLDAQDRYLLTELGSNAFGEIAKLARLVQPDVALVTRVAEAHLEGFGSLAGVLKEKRELPMSLSERGTAVYPSYDELLSRDARSWPGKKVSFGYSPEDIVRIVEMREGERASGVLEYRGKRVRLTLPVPGAFNILNAAGALAMSVVMGADFEAGVEAIARNWTGLKMRMERVTAQGVEFLVDAYNANPESMKAAVATLVALKGTRRGVVVAGALLELGERSATLHEEVGRHAMESGVDLFIGVGEAWRDFALKGGIAGTHYAAGHEEAAKLLRELCKTGDLVLLKGSRGAAMELVLEHFGRSEKG